jgi:hypothetical protein
VSIPDEAVEAAMKHFPPLYTSVVLAALEAAAPILLSHEREETRLAHLDAMVNRETNRAELAQAWDEGCEEGMSWNPGHYDEAIAANPYRSQA